MANITIITGIILVIMGVGSYFGTGSGSVTALIPTFFGVPIAALGVVSRNEKYRMHAMHVAVLLGLIGFLGGAVMGIKGLATGKLDERPVAVVMQLVMGVVCLVFVVLCVKSFIDVRKARQAKAKGQDESP